jgi:indole-3-glycerol phosphate synthase
MTASTPPDLLATIVAAAERIVEVRASEVSMPEMETRCAAMLRRPQGAAIESGLRDSAAPRVIAECKRRSPSRGILRQDYRPDEHARAYAAAGAAAISVLTEPTFFDGALEHLQRVRAAVQVPLLRKDFIVHRYQLLEAVLAGAVAVLLIVAALDDQQLRTLVSEAEGLGLACLVEVHDTSEIERAVAAGARVVGVNSRNLRTLAVNMDVLDRAASLLPRGVTAVAESGIRTPQDIELLSAAGYHAFLVGERLITQPDPGAALRGLRGR